MIIILKVIIVLADYMQRCLKLKKCLNRVQFNKNRKEAIKKKCVYACDINFIKIKKYIKSLL
jgi:predicted transcriptional regulator